MMMDNDFPVSIEASNPVKQAQANQFLNQFIASSPSFDLRYPKTPGIGSQNQSIEGIPNASPELIRKFVERKLKNPGGQELPGFLKGA